MADGSEMQRDPTVYWADLPPDQIAAALTEQTDKYFEALDAIRMRSIWGITYSQLFGMDPRHPGEMVSHRINFDGEEEENIIFRVNDTRSLLKQSVTLAIGQRPAYQCLAINDDFDSMAQVATCDSAFTYVMNRAYGEDLERYKVELAKMCGWSWDWHRWDHEGGDDVEVAPNDPQAAVMQKVRSGAPTVTPVPAWRAAHDTGCKDGRHAWVIIAEDRSKWELAASHTFNAFTGEDQTADILAIDCSEKHGFSMLSSGSDDWMQAKDSDAVTVRHFYHARTAALPDGRYVGVAGNIVLWDWPLPSAELPATCFMPTKLADTAFGYSDVWDMLPMQQMADQLISDQATNATLFGRPNAYMDEGTTMTASDIGRGGSLFTKKPGTEPPGIVQYPAMNEQPMNLMEHILSRQAKNFGLNESVRGAPGSETSSGTSQALMHSQALEFASADTQALDASRIANGNLTLNSIKQNALYPFVIEVAGESEKPYASSFDVDKFKAVKRVHVTTISPMLKTQAGRTDVYDKTKDIPNAWSNPQQVVQFLSTGQWKPTHASASARSMRIKWENEQLAKGIMVPVAAGQNPFSTPGTQDGEVQAHLDEMFNALRMNDQNAVRVFGEHIAQHEQVWLQTSPFMCAFLGIPPPPQASDMQPGDDASGKGARGPQKAQGGKSAPSKDEPAPQEPGGPSGGLGVPLPKPAQPPAQANVTH